MVHDPPEAPRTLTQHDEGRGQECAGSDPGGRQALRDARLLARISGGLAAKGVCSLRDTVHVVREIDRFQTLLANPFFSVLDESGTWNIRRESPV